MIGGDSAHEIITKAQDIEEQGFESVWMANFIGYGLDPLHSMGLIAKETERIKLGTAVVPIFLHHPLALAHQAISIQKTAGGRFTLGIGFSHPFIVDDWLGLSYESPITKMREYLSILGPLLNGEAASFEGTFFSTNAGVHVPDVDRVPLLVAAMGPQMLKLAGIMADGTVPYLTGLNTLESHIIPKIQSAAATAGRTPPRIVATGLPIALVNNRESALVAITERWAGYGDLPSYRAMFDREGVDGAAGVSLVGGEARLRKAIQRLKDIGVTEFVASPVAVEEDTVERTLDFLASQL